jgi:hypothetical protein
MGGCLVFDVNAFILALRLALASALPSMSHHRTPHIVGSWRTSQSGPYDAVLTTLQMIIVRTLSEHDTPMSGVQLQTSIRCPNNLITAAMAALVHPNHPLVLCSDGTHGPAYMLSQWYPPLAARRLAFDGSVVVTVAHTMGPTTFEVASDADPSHWSQVRQLWVGWLC